MEPMALQKAKAMVRFMRGAPMVGAFVTLNDREAFELLQWCSESQGYGNNPAFVAELNAAKALRNPWPVLEGFHLCGFPLTRIEEEVH
jgi:hypothetical protein